MENKLPRKDFCKKQIGRLFGLDRFPTEADAITELISALQTARTEAQARWIIDGITRYSNVCPTPAEIYAAINADSEQGREKRDRSTRDCEICGGTGFVTAFFLRTVAWYETHGRLKRRVTSERITGDGYTLPEGCGYSLAEHASRELAKKIGRDQEVYSGCEECSCRRVAA